MNRKRFYGETSKNDVSSRPTITEMRCKMTWKELVEKQATAGKLKGVTCGIYSRKSKEVDMNTKPCCCGRSLSLHSFDGDPEVWDITQICKFKAGSHAIVTNLSTYGELKNGARV